MAKRNEDEKSWLSSYNSEAEKVRFAASLTKPAFGRIVEVPGYENILWGGRTAGNLGFNLQKAYQNLVLDFAVHQGGYRPSRPNLGVAAQIEEARAEGKVAEGMHPMTPAHWRAVLANLPLASTEGGVGLSVGGMIGLLAGLSDLANGRNTANFRNLVHHLRKLAEISPQYKQFLRDSQDGEDAALSSMFAEFNEAYERNKAAV